jgi:hypothetical protein
VVAVGGVPGARDLYIAPHGKSGLDTLKEWRARGVTTPVLILTARGNGLRGFASLARRGAFSVNALILEGHCGQMIAAERR